MNVGDAASAKPEAPAGELSSSQAPPGVNYNSVRRLAPVRVGASRPTRAYYSNAVIANGTSDDVVLQFGANQPWDRLPHQMAKAPYARVVMNPHAVNVPQGGCAMRKKASIARVINAAHAVACADLFCRLPEARMPPPGG